MIYVPDLTYSCYVVIDSNTIRAYKDKPLANITTEYRDYYVNSHYLYKDGSVQFSTYSQIPTCIDSTILSDYVFYRNDIADILIIFSILSIVFFGLPIKIFKRFFKRFL